MQKEIHKGKMEDKSWVGFPNSHLALSLELGKPTEHPQPAWTSPNHTHLANHSEKLNITSHSTSFLDGKAHELLLVEDFFSRSLLAHCIIALIARRLKYRKA